MAESLSEDIHHVSGPAFGFYILRDGESLYLIDSGFIGGRRLLRKALKARGWEKLSIKGIVVTHGHLDHILNVSSFAQESGAWVAAPYLDAAHYEGRYAYRGPARICGLLEAIGRALLGYEPFRVNRWLEDGEELPIWDRLKVVHLPGHTDGHIGLYSSSRKLLFCADLFASYANLTHLPPAILNSHSKLIPASVAKALSLDLAGVLLHHCDSASPREHLARLVSLFEKANRSASAAK